MNKWLFEICNNRRTVVPKSEMLSFMKVCNDNGIVSSIYKSYPKYDKFNPYVGIDEGVVFEFEGDLDIHHGFIIASNYKNKAEKYKQLIKKGYDVFSALKALRI